MDFLMPLKTYHTGIASPSAGSYRKDYTGVPHLSIINVAANHHYGKLKFQSSKEFLQGTGLMPGQDNDYNQNHENMSDILGNQILQRLKEKMHKEDLQCEELTARQLFITKLLARGYTQKEVADYLCLSEQTVSSHLKNIYDTLNIHKQTELVVWYFRQLFNGDGKGKNHLINQKGNENSD